jgi:hypothetical protein
MDSLGDLFNPDVCREIADDYLSSDEMDTLYYDRHLDEIFFALNTQDHSGSSFDPYKETNVHNRSPPVPSSKTPNDSKRPEVDPQTSLAVWGRIQKMRTNTPPRRGRSKYTRPIIKTKYNVLMKPKPMPHLVRETKLSMKTDPKAANALISLM